MLTENIMSRNDIASNENKIRLLKTHCIFLIDLFISLY